MLILFLIVGFFYVHSIVFYEFHVFSTIQIVATKKKERKDFQIVLHASVCLLSAVVHGVCNFW